MSVKHPRHYCHGLIEPWDVVQDWNLDYWTGSAIKYIGRHQHKGDPVKDLKKAIVFLQRRVKDLEPELLYAPRPEPPMYLPKEEDQDKETNPRGVWEVDMHRRFKCCGALYNHITGCSSK